MKVRLSKLFLTLTLFAVFVFFDYENVNASEVDQVDISTIRVEAYYDDNGYDVPSPIRATGEILKPYIMVFDDTAGTANSIIYKENIDFVVDYGEGNYKDVGTYKITVTGIGKFKGTVVLDWTLHTTKLTYWTGKCINGFYEGNCMVNYDTYNGFLPSYSRKGIYNGKIQKPKLQLRCTDVGDTNGTMVTMKEGIDYIVNWGKGNYKDAGTYTYTITGIGIYEGNFSVDYTIKKEDVFILMEDYKTRKQNNTTLRDEYTYEYTGKKITPKYRVIIANLGTKLSSKDYKIIKGSSRKSVGESTFTIKIKGKKAKNLKDAKVVWRVVPSKNKITSLKSNKKGQFTVKYTKPKGKINSYEIYYKKNGTSKWQKVKVASKKTKTTVNGLAAGNYKVKVKSVYSKKVYSSFSKTKTVKVK